MVTESASSLPGVALLEECRVKRGLNRTALAALITERSGIKVDRVTVGNLLDGDATRVSVIVAGAIWKALRIPMSAWVPVERDDSKVAR